MKRKIFILLLLVILWVSATWYLGYGTEKIFKEEPQTNEYYHFEQLSYQKTLLGAKARIRLSSKLSFIGEETDNLELNIKLQNGPFFIDDSGINIGKSRWSITSGEGDLSNIKSNKTDFLLSLKNATVRIDFDKKAHYLLKVKLSNTLAIIKGVYDLQTGENLGSLHLEGLNIDSPQGKLIAEKAKISYQYENMGSSGNNHGVVTVDIPSLQFFNNKDVIESDLNSTSVISFKDNALSGTIKINVNVKNAVNQPIKNIKSEFAIKGISKSGMMDLYTAYDHLNNLSQQANWQQEENGEFPDGQDQIWQIYDQVETLSRQLPDLLKNEVLNANSSFRFKIDVASKSGFSKLSGQIERELIESKAEMIKTRGGVFDTSNQNGSLSILQLLSTVLKGEANVKLDKRLLEFISKRTVIDRDEFKLIWKRNKLLMK